MRVRDVHARREYVRLCKLESRRVLGVCRLGSLTHGIFNVREAVSFGRGGGGVGDGGVNQPSRVPPVCRVLSRDQFSSSVHFSPETVG